MEKILGIDTGTNSLGWAIVERNGNEYHLLEKGTKKTPKLWFDVGKKTYTAAASAPPYSRRLWFDVGKLYKF